MRIKALIMSLTLGWAHLSLAGRAEWNIRLDTQSSPQRLCRNFNILFAWGHNLELRNVSAPQENTPNILYVGVEPVGEYYSPRRELTGAIRYGGQRGDRVWLLPSRSDSRYIEAVLVDPRFGPFQNYCVYIPQAPIPRGNFE